MPSALREHQYELLPVDSPGEGLVFGTEDTGYLTINRPTFTAGEMTGTDSNRPGEDGVMFGRDYRGAKSLSFEMAVLTDVNNAVLAPGSVHAAHQMNLDYLEALEGWWNDPLWRQTARSLAMLRVNEAGRTSRCYGRPRRYDEIVGATTRQGYSNVVCDFQLIENYWYADAEDEFTAALYTPPTSGLVTPLVTPLTTTREVYLTTSMQVGGQRPTWLVVEIKGPVTNPVVEVGGLDIAFDGTIPSGQTYVIDPRPWVRTAYRKADGASVGGMLARATPALRNLRVKPGSHVVLFRGLDATGTATARLRWRECRTRP